MTEHSGMPPTPGFGTPQPAQPPGFEFTTTPTPPQAGNRNGKTVALVAGATAAVLLLGGGAYAGMKLMSHGEQPDTVIPGTAVAFMRVDLDPSAGQKIAAFRLFDKLPQTKGALTSEDPKRGLFDLIKKNSTDLADVDYDKDIAPWMGDRFAAAVVPGKDGKAVPLVALAVKDEGKARDGIAKLTDKARKVATKAESAAPSGTGIDTQEETVNLFRDGYLLSVPKSAEREVTAAIDAGKLATKDAYVNDMKALGDPGVMSAWYDPKAAQGLLDTSGSSSANNAFANTPLAKSFADMQKPVALTVRLSADAFELVSNGADPGIVKNAGPVQNLTNLPSDTVAFVSMRGLGATVENLWQPMMETLDQVSPSYRRQIADFQTSSGISLPGDLTTLLGRQLDVVIPESLFDKSNPGGGGVRLETDTDKAQAVLDKFERLLNDSNKSSGTTQIPRQVDGSHLLLGGTTADVSRLASTGDLGKDSPLAAAMPQLADANTAIFADLDRVEERYLNQVPADYREAVRSLKAVGYTAGSKDGRQVTTLRLLVN